MNIKNKKFAASVALFLAAVLTAFGAVLGIVAAAAPK